VAKNKFGGEFFTFEKIAKKWEKKLPKFLKP
jgi:hypothetical protein